ncbi:hypothetical protein ABEB36_008175 [Hypothenemus hampei]|uniref:Myrosinase 1-like n=1 Tax=Hypothenemus hampei TaxID=57062 RepID=A0ABD1ENY6_HYPHA
MKTTILLVSTFLLLVQARYEDDYVVNNRTFPKGFKFGTASAAYQIEGAWNEDGKGENVWDRSTHLYPEKNSNATGDVTSDAYHKWEEDVELLKGLGVSAYRFSIAWSRVLPKGFANESNPAGVTYYKNLIAGLKKYNIEPLVTMHHWDLPTALEDLGGFLNSDIQEWFVDYARFLFETFGDDVKEWVTFNEPKQTCDQGYGSGVLAPNIVSLGIKNYICGHNLIIAHGKAYRLYDKEFRAKQQGRVTMVVDSNWFEPASNSTEDVEASERSLLFTYGWFAHPIVYGDYPEIMKVRIANRSKLEGFNSSRLPSFTDEEKQIINGTADFMTVNIYTSSVAQAIPEPDITPLDPKRDLDIGAHIYQPDDWEKTITDWFKVVPWGARKLVKWISDTYGHPEIIITENGYHDNGTVINDLNTRGRYYKLYLSNLLDAIYYDNVNLTGYMAWSLTDDFEWQYGYNIQLGLYHVDFSSLNRTRTPKESSTYYRKVVTTSCLVDTCVE